MHVNVIPIFLRSRIMSCQYTCLFISIFLPTSFPIFPPASPFSHLLPHFPTSLTIFERVIRFNFVNFRVKKTLYYSLHFLFIISLLLLVCFAMLSDSGYRIVMNTNNISNIIGYQEQPTIQIVPDTKDNPNTSGNKEHSK